MELNNSTVLITGGTSGIGLEFVKQLTKQGAHIIVTGRNKEKLDQLKTQFPGIAVFKSNVGNPKDNETLRKQVIQQFPELSIIINNAGIMRHIDLHNPKYDFERIADEVEINLSGTIRMVHQFLPHLKTKRSAAIINVSSGLAFVPFPLSPVYSASKAGVHAYTKVLRLQLKNTKVKVFELAPPGTDTPLQTEFDGLADGIQQYMKVEKMVSIAIQGILKDKLEIRPGMANLLKVMSRIAPNFILNQINNSLAKAKAKKISFQHAK